MSPVSPYRQFSARLVGRREVCPSFLRITLAGQNLASVSDVLGDQRVKLVLGSDEALAVLAGAEPWFETWRTMPDELRPAIRTFTLSGMRSRADLGPEAGEVDIDLVRHAGADGPASRFAEQAPIGSLVGLLAADRRREGHEQAGIGWHPRGANTVLMVGDETALPALSNLLRDMDRAMTGQALVEVPAVADIRDLGEPDGVQVHWFPRDEGRSVFEVLGHEHEGHHELDEADMLWSEGQGAGRYLWAAGESGWVRRIRVAARAQGWPSSQMSLMGYWKRGVAGS